MAVPAYGSACGRGSLPLPPRVAPLLSTFGVKLWMALWVPIGVLACVCGLRPRAARSVSGFWASVPVLVFPRTFH